MRSVFSKSIAIFSILFAGSFHFVYAQNEVPPEIRWMRTYSAAQGNGIHDQLYDVYRLEQGFAMTGIALANGGARSWVVVTTEDGDPQIDRLIVNPIEEAAQGYGKTLIQTEDGGLLVGINSFLNGVGNFDMLKLSDDGEISWYRTICEYRPMLTGCYGVIELKDGTYCGAGMGRLQGGALARAFATVITDNPNEEPVWATDFPAGFFRAVREVPEEGLIFCGFTNRMLMKTDFNGEILWTRNYDNGALHDLVSCPAGGYASAGSYQGGFGLLRVNHDGEHLWDGSYPFEDVGNQAAQSLAVMQDGGFILGGSFTRQDHQQVGAVVRTDPQGNLLWNLRLDELPAPFENYIIETIETVLVEPDGAVIMTGNSVHTDVMNQTIREGILVILEPDRSPPVFVEWTPWDLEFETLQGDSIEFSVRVIDAQQDDISYVWTFNADTVGVDSTIAIAFEDLDVAEVKCWVSDGFFADSLVWSVTVTDFFISAFSPDSVNMRVRRNSDIAFAVETRSLSDEPISYTWFLDNEQVGEADTVGINFSIGRNRSVIAGAFQDGREDWQQWTVSVISAIGDYFPTTTNLMVMIDTTLGFWIEPFNVESDSVSYLWLVDGDSMGTDQSYERNFDSTGEYTVTAFLFDGSDGDSVTWNIDVRAPDAAAIPESLLPSSISLSAFPNPFNSSTTIHYSLPKSGRYTLDVVDIQGRLVTRLSDGWKEAGSYREVLNGGKLASGSYRIVIGNGNARLNQIVQLVR